MKVTDEHGEMCGSLKIPAGWKLGSAVTISAMHDSQFSCAFVSHFDLRIGRKRRSRTLQVSSSKVVPAKM